MQDTYYELTLEVTEYKNIINDFLVSATDVGFEEFENTYIVRSEDHLDDLAWAIKSFIKKLNIAFSTNISYKINILKQKTDDWVKIYQSAVKPILVKPFYVRPTCMMLKMIISIFLLIQHLALEQVITKQHQVAWRQLGVMLKKICSLLMLVAEVVY